MPPIVINPTKNPPKNTTTSVKVYINKHFNDQLHVAHMNLLYNLRSLIDQYLGFFFLVIIINKNSFHNQYFLLTCLFIFLYFYFFIIAFN